MDSHNRQVGKQFHVCFGYFSSDPPYKYGPIPSVHVLVITVGPTEPRGVTTLPPTYNQISYNVHNYGNIYTSLQYNILLTESD